jgi:hypothetical protein
MASSFTPSANGWSERTAISICALVCKVQPAATTPASDTACPRVTQPGPSSRFPPFAEGNVNAAPLTITNVRLESSPAAEKAPSAILKFHAFNASPHPLTEIIFDIRILERFGRNDFTAPSPILAGPFTIRGNIVLDPRYTADFEMVLRNLSPACGCEPRVRVVSVRSLPRSGP